MKTNLAISGREAEVLAGYGIEFKTAKHECPICSKTEFRFSEAQLGYRAGFFCDGDCKANGDVINFLERYTGKNYSELCKEIDQMLGNKSGAELVKPANALKNYSSLKSYLATPADYYLQSRGINTGINIKAKYLDNAVHPESGNTYGALVVAAVNGNGELHKTHRTYVNQSWDCPDSVNGIADKNRKTMHSHVESTAGVHARLMSRDLGGPLGIGEGIESSLSASQVFDMPVWATLDAANMDKFIAPIDVTVLDIFCDWDRNGKGIASATRCAHKNLVSKSTGVEAVRIRWAECGDWNDYLLNPSSKTNQIIIGNTEFLETNS